MIYHVFYNKLRLDRLKSPSASFRFQAFGKSDNTKLWDISSPKTYEALKAIFLDSNQEQLIQESLQQYLIIESSCCPCSTHNFPAFIKPLEYDQIIQSFHKKCYLLEDIHGYTHSKFGKQDYSDLVQWLFRNNIEIMISFVDNWEWDMIKAKSLKLLPNLQSPVIPHHINSKVFYDYKLPKKWDVFMYGACFLNAYPFRVRLNRLLRKSDLNCYILQSPGDFQRDPRRSGANLAKMINQSWLTIATYSKYKYLVAKYFEIAACNSLVVGNMPGEPEEHECSSGNGRQIWKDNFVEINENMTDQEIINTIKEALKNKDLIKEKAAKMYELVHEEYNMNKYVEKVINTF